MENVIMDWEAARVYMEGEAITATCEDGFMSGQRTTYTKVTCTERTWAVNPPCFPGQYLMTRIQDIL